MIEDAISHNSPTATTEKDSSILIAMTRRESKHAGRCVRQQVDAKLQARTLEFSRELRADARVKEA
jgi:hypothetical protein